MKTTYQTGLCLLCCAAVAVLSSSCYVKRVNAVERSVSVTGSGSVEVPPDRATIALSVVTRNWDAAQAAAENASRMTAVQSAMIALGVDSQAVSTSNYNVSRESVYTNGVSTPGQYRVSNRLSVVLTDLDLVGKVIDAAMRAGANEVSSVDFSSTDTENALREARILAMQQAESSARLLANNAQARIGKTLKIDEVSGVQPLRAVANKMAIANDAPAPRAVTPVSAGSGTVTVTVSVTYELK